MKYVIDTEFIDTPSCSALISLAIVCEKGPSRYFEFEYPRNEITPWLAANVVPHLRGDPHSTFAGAAEAIQAFIGDDQPEFWCYYGAYDWYWFCRLWGGFMQMPQRWPHLFREFAYVQQGVPDVAGAEHNALNDCRSILEAMKLKGLVSEGDSNG
jgi:hypothetical protein